MVVIQVEDLHRSENSTRVTLKQQVAQLKRKLGQHAQEAETTAREASREAAEPAPAAKARRERVADREAPRSPPIRAQRPSERSAAGSADIFPRGGHNILLIGSESLLIRAMFGLTPFLQI